MLPSVLDHTQCLPRVCHSVHSLGVLHHMNWTHDHTSVLGQSVYSVHPIRVTTAGKLQNLLVTMSVKTDT